VFIPIAFRLDVLVNNAGWRSRSAALPGELPTHRSLTRSQPQFFRGNVPATSQPGTLDILVNNAGTSGAATAPAARETGCRTAPPAALSRRRQSNAGIGAVAGDQRVEPVAAPAFTA
jgi:hypothetical protein